MADERRDYAILISLSMREEAEVMASALRAEGINAFVAPTHHANCDWGIIIALGGMQVFVPRQRIAEAKEIIRERIREAAADPQGEPVSRRDRYKVWLVILWSVGSTVALWLWAQGVIYERSGMSDFEAAAEYQENLDRAYCEEHPYSEVVRYDEYGAEYFVRCSQVLK